MHLWYADMDDPLWEHGEFFDLLAAEERTRAQRFSIALLRQRFIASHGLQRLLLASYIGQPPRDLRFAYGQRGKPSLTCYSSASLPRFNVSHSQNLLMCAIAGNKEVGVDVEYQRPLTDLTAMAKNAFTAAEYARFSQAEASEKREHFFRIWTCKEACLKATGEGIPALDTVDIDLQREAGSSFFTHVSIVETGDKAWSVYSFSPVDGFAAALAVEGRPAKVSHFKQLMQ